MMGLQIVFGTHLTIQEVADLRHAIFVHFCCVLTIGSGRIQLTAPTNRS